MTDPRVLLVTKGLDLGGLERVVVDLAIALQRRGLSVEVALINDSRAALVPALERSGVVVHRLGGSDRIGAAAARRYSRLVSAGSFDVIHAHGPLTAVLARLLSGGRPVVSTVHTVWGALHQLTRAAWLVTLPKEAATVAVSKAVALSLPGWVAKRTVVIPHGVDPEAIERALASAQTSDDSADAVAIVVASHRAVKGYPTLLRALKVTRDRGVDLRLVAVGEGPDLARHRGLAEALGVSGVVDFRPPTEDVLTTIAESDFLVVASGREGQPLVVAEALALALPVVATSVGRVPDLVDEQVGRIVPTSDVVRLAEALIEVASQPHLRQSMQRSARLRRPTTVADAARRHESLYVKMLPATRRLDPGPDDSE